MNKYTKSNLEIRNDPLKPFFERALFLRYPKIYIFTLSKFLQTFTSIKLLLFKYWKKAIHNLSYQSSLRKIKYCAVSSGFLKTTTSLIKGFDVRIYRSFKQHTKLHPSMCKIMHNHQMNMIIYENT